MSEDTRNSGRPDRNRINLDHAHAVRDFSEALGVTEEQLRKAAQIVGNSASTLREYFRSRKGTVNEMTVLLPIC